MRQLVLTGAAAPWDGHEGLRQQRLGVLNACAIASNLTKARIDVVVADVVTPGTLAFYREHLPGCLVVRLTVSLTEARRRAASRRVWLGEEEFLALNETGAMVPPEADHVRDVTSLDLAAQAAAVERVWAEAAAGCTTARVDRARSE